MYHTFIPWRETVRGSRSRRGTAFKILRQQHLHRRRNRPVLDCEGCGQDARKGLRRSSRGPASECRKICLSQGRSRPLMDSSGNCRPAEGHQGGRLRQIQGIHRDGQPEGPYFPEGLLLIPAQPDSDRGGGTGFRDSETLRRSRHVLRCHQQRGS